MASGGRRGPDRVLESRHLVGLFLGVVLLCGVFFTLGYVMGHSPYGGPVHAADVLERSVSPVRPPLKTAERDAPPPVPANNEWDFYSKNNDNRLEPAAAPSSPSAAPPPVPEIG